MIGKTFGRLAVLSEDKNSSSKRRRWNCLCICGNEKSVRQDHLRSGMTTSCGCLHKERTRAAVVKPNRFEIRDGYVVAYANNTGSEFYVDLEDWPSVSKNGWYADHRGYICARVGGRLTRLHRMIMAAPGEYQIDHIDRNPGNNRKNNLRLATNSQNQMNKTESINNKSGKRGVFWREDRQKWIVRVGTKHIGMYTDFDEAVAARDRAAKEIYGEFA